MVAGLSTINCGVVGAVGFGDDGDDTTCEAGATIACCDDGGGDDGDSEG